MAGRSGRAPWACEQLQEPRGRKQCYGGCRGLGGGSFPSCWGREGKGSGSRMTRARGGGLEGGK